MRRKLLVIEELAKNYKSQFNIRSNDNVILIRSYPDVQPDVSKNLCQSELEKLKSELQYDIDLEFRSIELKHLEESIQLKVKI